MLLEHSLLEMQNAYKYINIWSCSNIYNLKSHILFQHLSHLSLTL